jgi:hypothetical protein
MVVKAPPTSLGHFVSKRDQHHLPYDIFPKIGDLCVAHGWAQLAYLCVAHGWAQLAYSPVVIHARKANLVVRSRGGFSPREVLTQAANRGENGTMGICFFDDSYVKKFIQ